MSQEYISDIVMKSPSNAYIQGMQIIIYENSSIFLPCWYIEDEDE